MSQGEEALYARIDKAIAAIDQRLDGVREWVRKDTEQAAIEAEELVSEASSLEGLFDKLMRIQVNQ